MVKSHGLLLSGFFLGGEGLFIFFIVVVVAAVVPSVAIVAVIVFVAAATVSVVVAFVPVVFMMLLQWLLCCCCCCCFCCCCCCCSIFFEVFSVTFDCKLDLLNSYFGAQSYRSQQIWRRNLGMRRDRLIWFGHFLQRRNINVQFDECTQVCLQQFCMNAFFDIFKGIFLPLKIMYFEKLLLAALLCLCLASLIFLDDFAAKLKIKTIFKFVHPVMNTSAILRFNSQKNVFPKWQQSKVQMLFFATVVLTLFWKKKV